jgi:hypothetical protein
MEIPKFKTKKELFDFLIENKEILIAQKKAITKYSDGFDYIAGNMRGPVMKANSVDGVLNVLAVINTTNVIDSHDDVHIPGLWDKSIRENKNIMHLQEHEMKFDSIISDGKDLKVSAENKTWKELGFGFKGNTEALIFDSTVKRSRNKYMHNQYADGNVKNHSVGMRYVKLSLAINDEDAGSNFDTWEKHIDQVANKEIAEGNGFFWAVTEAKIIEGSAVPIGSNQFTPTLENNKEPVKATPAEPVQATHINEFKNILKEVL